MKIIRANIYDNTLTEYKSPITPQMPNTELIVVFDQSTTSTGITIGDRHGRVYELLNLKRTGQETSSDYLGLVKSYIGALLAKTNVLSYVLEDAVGYRDRFGSQQVTASTFYKFRDVYSNIACVDGEGNPVMLKGHAEFVSVNNKEWYSEVIPKEINKAYKDKKEASKAYASTKYPILSALPDDVADSYCMYEYVLMTRYGVDNLKATKSTVKRDHNLVILGMPWKGLDSSNKDYMSFANQDGSVSEEQQIFYRMYKKSAVLFYLNLLQNKTYKDPFIEHDLDLLTEIVGRSFVYKSKFMQDEYLEQAQLFNVDGSKEVVQFKYNDKLTMEENFRCFTSDKSKIFYTIITGNNVCNFIAQFQLHLNYGENIILIGTKKE